MLIAAKNSNHWPPLASVLRWALRVGHGGLVSARLSRGEEAGKHLITNLRSTKDAVHDWFPPEEKELVGSLALSPSLVLSNLMVLFRFLQKGSCGASQASGSGPLFARELAGAECYKKLSLPCAVPGRVQSLPSSSHCWPFLQLHRYELPWSSSLDSCLPAGIITS